MPKKKAFSNEHGLTEKEYCFLQEYVSNGFNGTQAALETYKCSNDKVAASKASDILRKKKVKEALKKEMQSFADSYSTSKENVIRELSLLAYSDMRDYIDFAGDVVELKSSDEIGVKTKAIKEITITPVRLVDSEGESYTGNKVNLKLYDKQKSLELIGKTQEMFSDKTEINIHDNMNFTLELEGGEYEEEEFEIVEEDIIENE